MKLHLPKIQRPSPFHNPSALYYNGDNTNTEENALSAMQLISFNSHSNPMLPVLFLKMSLKYSWFSMLCSFLPHSKWLSYMCILFHILFHYGYHRILNTVSCAIQCESESHSVVADSLQPHGLYNPWNFPGQNTGVGSRSLLQGIFPTQG